jgi:hypothetical protein
MKKALSIIIVCGLLACTAFSCGDSGKSEKNGKKSKSSAVTEEKTTAAEEGSTTSEKTESTTEEKTESEEKTTEKESENHEETTEDKKGGAPAEDTPQLREAKDCVKKYIESTLGSDAEVLFGYSYPKETIEYLKSSGKWESLAGSYASINSEGGDSSKIEDVEISDETVLSEKAIEGAAAYFDSMNSIFGGEPLKCSITSGYCMTLKAKITYAGETMDSSEPVSAVYIKDDGWKVIPMDGEYLESMASFGG